MNHSLSKKAVEGRGLELVELALAASNIHFKIEGGDVVFSLRPEDHNPSCRAKRTNDGGWVDFGTDERGDAFTLIARLEGLDVRRDFGKVLERAYDLLRIPKPITQHNPARKEQGHANGSQAGGKPRVVLSPPPTLDEFLSQYGLEWSDFEAAGVTGPKPFYFPQIEDEAPALIYPITRRDGTVVPKAKTIARDIDKHARQSASVKGSNFIKGFFGNPADAAGRTLVIAGGEEKRIAALKSGFASVSVTNGEKVLDPDALAMILEAAPAEIIIAYDADKAGFQATSKLARQLAEAGYKSPVRTVPWTKDTPEKHDLNDVLKARGVQGLRDFLADAKIVEQDGTLPPELLCTDIANAIRFADRFHPRIAFNGDHREWLHYSGKHWSSDVNGANAKRLAASVPRMILKEAAKASRGATDELIGWAKTSGKLPRINAMLELAATDPRIFSRAEDYDKDNLILNVQNGTVNLTTGELRPHSPEDRISRICPISFEPGATCPRWLKFLDQIMGGDQELVSYLQRAVGYALTGLTTEQCYFILYGTGANGKTTFLETIRWMLGGYARQADPRSFLQDDKGGGSGGQARPDLVALVGARFVTATEVDRGKRIAEALVKALSGQDSQLIRTLYGTPFDWIPNMKLFMASNHKPVIAGADEGTWRRIRLVPFAIVIPPEGRDKNLPETLRREGPGILNWALQGTRDWMSQSLLTPRKVREATNEYRDESDRLAGFLSDCCNTGANLSESTGALYAAYTGWCQQEGENPLKQNSFGASLKERGLKSYKAAKGKRRWAGISLRTPGEDSNKQVPADLAGDESDFLGGGVAQGGAESQEVASRARVWKSYPESAPHSATPPPSTFHEEPENYYPDYDEEERRAIQDY